MAELLSMAKLVYLESPFAGDVETNLEYARACMSDCIKRGESPLASHLLYTQPGILDDDIPEERVRGIQAGFDWAGHADLIVFYIDLGMSSGMKGGVKRANEAGQPVEYRSLEAWKDRKTE